jgi:arylsulfatase A-like enzyme
MPLPDSTAPATAPRRLGPIDVLVLAVWCGLAAGLLEVGTRIVCRSLDPNGRMFLMTRHFVWLAPLSNLLLFAVMAPVLALATKLWPRAGGWFCPRLICFWSAFPSLMLASSRIYATAWALLAIGVAWRVTPLLERHAAGLRRRLLLSFPLLLVLVGTSAGFVFGGDWLKVRRETRRPLPSKDAPNVLLVVLDTVRADRLSLYGYERATTPVLDKLARRGIRFDRARAPAPWTLPSHATMFTGRWPHELGVKWGTPVGTKFATVAEYLGSSGYATAGFVANTLICSSELGLDRGFTHYEDYVLEQLSPFRTAWLVDHALLLLSDLGLFLGRSPVAWLFGPLQETVFQPLFTMDRKKDAGMINRELLSWLSQRREPGRPFFAFLNYYDAHAPYVLPAGAAYRFGEAPQSQSDFMVLVEQWASIDKALLPPQLRSLARDCYDNCVAYLDERLGELFDELDRRGVLAHTILIVVSDHGEGLGERDLFDHGESLYSTEIRVPLVVVLPGGESSPRVVREPVSLRDLPATIVQLAGLERGSPIPGRSLVDRPHPSAAVGWAPDGAVFSELPTPNPANPNHGRSPASRGPLVSLADGDYVYIRNEGDGAEELFNEQEDPRELTNRSRSKVTEPILDRFRAHLDQFRATQP